MMLGDFLDQADLEALNVPIEALPLPLLGECSGVLSGLRHMPAPDILNRLGAGGQAQDLTARSAQCSQCSRVKCWGRPGGSDPALHCHLVDTKVPYLWFVQGFGSARSCPLRLDHALPSFEVQSHQVSLYDEGNPYLAIWHVVWSVTDGTHSLYPDNMSSYSAPSADPPETPEATGEVLRLMQTRDAG